MTVLPDRRIVIPALGITQIFAWGSTFYLPAALAPLIARDTGWAYDLTVGGDCTGHCSLRRGKRDRFGCQGNGAAGAIRR